MFFLSGSVQEINLVRFFYLGVLFFVGMVAKGVIDIIIKLNQHIFMSAL
jgi:hypothetical protein